MVTYVGLMPTTAPEGTVTRSTAGRESSPDLQTTSKSRSSVTRQPFNTSKTFQRGRSFQVLLHNWYTRKKSKPKTWTEYG